MITSCISVPSGYRNEDGTYIVNDPEGEPCVMAYMKSRVTVSYIVKGKSTPAPPPVEIIESVVIDKDGKAKTVNKTVKPKPVEPTANYEVDRRSYYFNEKLKAQIRIDLQILSIHFSRLPFDNYNDFPRMNKNSLISLNKNIHISANCRETPERCDRVRYLRQRRQRSKP